MAVFERSFYLETVTGLICVGLPEIGRGPLNALLSSQHRHLPFYVTTGASVRISNSQIILTDRVVLDATQASAYHCELSFVTPAPQILQRNRNVLTTLQGMPEDGFSWLLVDHVSCARDSALQAALRRSASAHLKRLIDWLRSAFAYPSRDSDDHDASAAMGLLGAGPGLTPAGDDVIAGIMLALIRFQRADVAQTIWQAIQSSLPVMTNVISAAHLEQAAKGFCGEPTKDLLDKIFQSEKIEAATLETILNSMGCTSGWDTLGGVVMVIDAWQYSLNTTHRTGTTC